MSTIVHVTHEAVQKVGGIGAVLQGFFTAKAYQGAVRRSILFGPGDRSVTVRTLGGSRVFQVGLNGEGFTAKQTVVLRALNAAGRIVWQTTVSPSASGRSVTIDAARWACGIYLLKVDAPGMSEVLRLPLFR